MVSVYNMFFKIIAKISSISPVLSITDDAHYGYNEEGFSPKWRFSLLNLRLGNTTYYICSWSRNQASGIPKLVKKLNHCDCQWEMDDKRLLPKGDESSVDTNDEGKSTLLSQKICKFKELSDDYSVHLSDISDDDLEVEESFLKYNIENENSRSQTAMGKMTFYTMVILVVLPLFCGIAYTLAKEFSVVMSLLHFAILSVLLALLGYMLLNWMLLTIQFMSISAIPSSQFSKIREPDGGRDRKRQSLYNYYYDWRSKHDFSQLQVATVKATELFLQATLVLGLIVFLFVGGIDVALNTENEYVKIESGTSYLICIDELEYPFSDDSITLTKLHLSIKQMPPQYIIIMTKSSENLDVMTYFDKYEEYLPVYYLTDATLDDNEVRIGFGG